MRQTESNQAKLEASSNTAADFARLWERYARSVAYLVSRRLGHKETEDAVQEIMLRVYERRNQFDTSRSLTAWVYTIARNYCTDVLRRNLRRAERLGRQVAKDTAQLAAPRREQPELLVMHSEVQRALHRALETLGDTDRLILFLHYFEELPLAEVAQVVEKPTGTVKYRIHRAKRAIRREMEDYL